MAFLQRLTKHRYCILSWKVMMSRSSTRRVQCLFKMGMYFLTLWITYHLRLVAFVFKFLTIWQQNRTSFSADSYHQDSIKSQERVRRGCGEKFILQGSATRKPKDFKAFLTKDKNKRRFCEVLLQVWSISAAASRLERCTDVVIIVDGIAHKLLCSNKQVIFLVLFHISFNFLHHGIFFN